MKLSKAKIRAIKKAFEGVNRGHLADRLGCSRNLIDQYVSGHKVMSPIRAMKIEVLTGKKVTRHVLRPDVFKN